MKIIPLTQGKFATVDDEDHARLNQWKWYAVKAVRKSRTIWYALRAVSRPGGGQQLIRMHREIAAVAGIPQVDHRDNDGLNNQRSNLRPATQQQNSQNQSKQMGCTSTYKGVSWYRRRAKWVAHIDVSGRKRHLGYFLDELAAATAYNVAAEREFGAFAAVNRLHG